MLPAAPAGGSHLFGSAAGWDKAKSEHPRPILVWSGPALEIDLKAAVAPWNRIAGWELFRISDTRRRADVLFRRASETWVECLPSYSDSYRGCVVWTATSSTTTLRHELGHALGLADHVQGIVFEEGRHFEPFVCDDPAHPAYSPYHGVMSYCDWDQDQDWFRGRDHRMVVSAGYGDPRPARALRQLARRAPGPRSNLHRLMVRERFGATGSGPPV